MRPTLRRAKGFLPLLLSLPGILALTSCNAVRSTASAIGRGTAGMFSAPEAVPDRVTNPARRDARLSALWVGHATILLQMEDRFILTDPNLTPTAGMFSKRLVEPGIDPENLPLLDAVLISHMHMDHLSYGSLDLIEKKIGQLLVPEGGVVYMPEYPFPMDELASWQQWEKDGLRVTAVPVRHNGWRYGLDDVWMKKSFTGYIIEYRGMTVYFGGDTGYDSTLFRDTAKRFPRIDIAFLPIAPINPREYTGSRHADPLDAVRIYRDLGAHVMVPMHFGTFREALDSDGEARAALLSVMSDQHLTENEVCIMRIGEQRVFIGYGGSAPALPAQARY